MTNILDLTSGSTHATDNAVTLYMPPAEAARVLAYLDQVPNPAKRMAMQARAKHAGAARAERLHARINAGVELYRLQLANWTGTDTSRAIWLTKRIYPDGKTDSAGNPCGWRTVYNHLKNIVDLTL